MTTLVQEGQGQDRRIVERIVEHGAGSAVGGKGRGAGARGFDDPERALVRSLCGVVTSRWKHASSLGNVKPPKKTWVLHAMEAVYTLAYTLQASEVPRECVVAWRPAVNYPVPHVSRPHGRHVPCADFPSVHLLELPLVPATRTCLFRVQHQRIVDGSQSDRLASHRDEAATCESGEEGGSNPLEAGRGSTRFFVATELREVVAALMRLSRLLDGITSAPGASSTFPRGLKLACALAVTAIGLNPDASSLDVPRKVKPGPASEFDPGGSRRCRELKRVCTGTEGGDVGVAHAVRYGQGLTRPRTTHTRWRRGARLRVCLVHRS